MPSERIAFDLPSLSAEVAEALASVLRDKILAWEESPNEQVLSEPVVDSVIFRDRAIFTRLRSGTQRVCEKLAIYREECSDFDFAMECPLDSEQNGLSEEDGAPPTTHFEHGEHLGLFGALGAPVVMHEETGNSVVFTLAFRSHKIIDNTITNELEPAIKLYRVEVACPSIVEVAIQEQSP